MTDSIEKLLGAPRRRTINGGRVCCVVGEHGDGVVIYITGSSIREFIRETSERLDENGIECPANRGVWISEDLFFAGGGRTMEGDYDDVSLESSKWRRASAAELAAIGNGESPFAEVLL